MLNTEEGTVSKRLKKKKQKLCSVEMLERRLPIIKWLPKYTFTTLIQDMISGVTVGLIAVPQSITLAVISGLSPEYGLYSCVVGGFVYLVFGGIKVINIGPQAVLSAMITKYVVGYSVDFVVLATFLSGVIILLLAILRLGSVLEFVSTPVISGYTTAAVIQVLAAQSKSFFGLSGPSGSYFLESVFNIVQNATTATLWDPLLGFTSIGLLVLLNKIGEGCSRTDGFVKQLRWVVSLARSAVVMVFGMIIAFTLKKATGGKEPIALVGAIASGVPQIALPPFTTVIGNETYTFSDMLNVYGPQAVVIPFVAILQVMAISKVFVRNTIVDVTQEMISLGLSNLFGSFIRSIPVTGSFSRAALNASAGAQTTFGGIFTSFVIILALTTMTDAFYYIPRTSLAALIMYVVYPLLDFPIFCRLWRSNKKELLVLIVTVTISLCFGLEYGIVLGIVSDALILLYLSARPTIKQSLVSHDGKHSVLISLNDSMFYCAAEHLRRNILMSVNEPNSFVIIDGSNLCNIDTTVAGNLIGVARDLKTNSHEVLFLNFRESLQNMCIAIYPQSKDSFVAAAKVEDCFKGNIIKVRVD